MIEQKDKSGKPNGGSRHEAATKTQSLRSSPAVRVARLGRAISLARLCQLITMQYLNLSAFIVSQSITNLVLLVD